MKQRIASHAAKYGPNGSTTTRTSSERHGTISVHRSAPKTSSREFTAHSSISPKILIRAPDAMSPKSEESCLHKDYESMLAQFDEFCACAESAGKHRGKQKAKDVHTNGCSLLDDYLSLCLRHELPFRVFTHKQIPSFFPIETSTKHSLVLQCYLVCTHAAIDGQDLNFHGRTSKQTLTLQQKALCAMQNVIAERPNIVDDNLLLASAILMSVAVSNGAL